MPFCQRAQQLKASFERMNELLAQEHEALRAKDLDAIERISSDKNTQAQELDIIGKTMMREAGITAETSNDTSMTETIMIRCGDAQLAADIKQLAAEVQFANNRNGVLLHGMMRINEQTLNIITGRSDKVTTYQSGGQLKSTGSYNPNTLATA